LLGISDFGRSGIGAILAGIGLLGIHPGLGVIGFGLRHLK
jgi:hypothetical protein